MTPMRSLVVRLLHVVLLHNACASIADSRVLAHRVLLRCLKSEAYADRALHSELVKAPSSLTAQDRGMATELVYGVMRTTSSLDYQLEQLIKGGFAKKTQKSTLCALRIGAYEIIHLSTPGFAAVDQAVSLAGPQKSQRSFANGVLRNLVRRVEADELPQPAADEKLSPLRALAIETSTPEWLLRELSTPPKSGGPALLASFDELTAWARASSEKPPIALRVNRRRVQPEEVQSAFSAAGLSLQAVDGVDDALLLEVGGGQVSTLPGFAEGWWSVQDVGAQAVGLLAAPPAVADGTATMPTTVLDLCAAPGGKSTHLAELLHARGVEGGRVVSVEVHARKARLIEQACERLGHGEFVHVHVADATSADALSGALVASGAADGLADTVVLDAPCSGLGTLRRNPEHRYRPAAPKAYTALCALQGDLLDSAAATVRVGGSLTYSVCSPLHAETDASVAAFLERHAGRFEVMPACENAAVPPEYVVDSALLGPGTCVRTWTHRGCADSHFAVSLRRTAPP